MLTDDEIRQRLDSLTKPPDSLGQLETVAARLCAIQQTLTPQVTPRLLVVFTGDHGVTREGVTAWPSEVTGQMIRNMLAGGAASSVLARITQTELRVVDVGSRAPAHADSDSYRCAKISEGTANLAHSPAMDAAQFEAAFAVGSEEAHRAIERGIRVVAAGEMGIGNTTPAACVAALLGGWSAARVTGRGAGANREILTRKTKIVAAAVHRVRDDLEKHPTAAIAAVAGFEIAAIAGFFAAAAQLGLTIVLDGFIATAGAMIAERLHPGTATRMIASHSSAEPGHPYMLHHLGLQALLAWNMRLGEGTGALLAMPLLDAAAAITCDMATFESAGIVYHQK